MIKAIIFDCFGVLVADALRPRADALIKTDPTVAESMYGIMKRFDLGLITKQQSHAEIAQTLGMTVEEVDVLTKKGEVRNAALIGAIPQFKNYKLGLLSNIRDRQSLDEHFLPGELDTLFDQVIASGDVGIIKPDPAIYRLMAERLGVEPSECVMIDDHQSSVDGAKALGMQAIRYLTNQQVLDDLHQLIDNRGHEG